MLACLFVSKVTQKATLPIFTKLTGKVAYGPQKKIDSAGDPNHDMLGYDSVRPRQTHKILCMGDSKLLSVCLTVIIL